MVLDREPLKEIAPIFLGTLNGQIQRYNALGRVMAAVPDYYKAGKEADEEQLRGLQRDFKETGIIADTQYGYEADSLDATITHYPGSTVVQPRSQRLVIPVYRGVPVYEVVREEQGLSYLRANFDTIDSPEEMCVTLERLSGKISNNIFVWTPEQNDRRFFSQRAAWFISYSRIDSFNVCANDIISVGRSRGVMVNSVQN